MITVVIPTLDSERLLVPTLASLVAGSAEGIVREVVIADGGSKDETAKIADAAGCEFLSGLEDEGARLKAAADAARADWLLFLDPGSLLDDGWTREVGAFLARSGAASEQAATFHLAIDAPGVASRLAETAAVWRVTFLGAPRREQGLLIAKRFYRSLGGHTPGSHPHSRLFARIGRRRLVGLRARVVANRARG